MPETTPAEMLRQAAKLMRERAEAVPQDWRLIDSQIVAAGTGTLPGTDVIGTCMIPARAAYVAGMHPGVALAVADWLDVAADWVAAARALETSRWVTGALAVARAYLGGEHQ